MPGGRLMPGLRADNGEECPTRCPGGGGGGDGHCCN